MSFAPLHLPVHVLVGSSPDCACVGVTGRYTDRSSRTSLDLCGSASSLVFALRGKLPLRDAPEVVDGVSYRVQPPPDLREAELSTWSVHRSHPTVGCRRHGIVQHWQRKPTSVWRRTLTSFGFSAVSVSSFVYVVSLLLYATIYVVLPLLPTFLDPPWLLLSSHPARFDQPVVPPRTIVGLHHLHGRTSAFKNCPFGGSLPSILPSLSPWQSSALYYDCCVLRRLPAGHVPLGPVVPTVSTTVGLMVIMGGSYVWGAYKCLNLFNWRPGLLGKHLWGEKVILIWVKRCLVYLLVLGFASRGEYGGCFHVEVFLARFLDLCVDHDLDS